MPLYLENILPCVPCATATSDETAVINTKLSSLDIPHLLTNAVP